ncbi:MAG: 1-phosphofructokinase family hexose kinase [Aestuariivirga sp.]|uniref:1-phosphofructokinase family hexose kinase n=1 Tax=Aestuariivirga sp. TaxID=2650926 RepID=UPI0025BEBB1B|nr:1-phosphofructokinase family hexose kinase [Aestuariivirga sp.]MCA3560479.1 1-phosphofructokinase family hexose kinase [Aestuariivirga sp.]
MAAVLTITLNPTIDVFGEAARVQPTHKVRLTDTSFEPGGGGINVARVISTLGGEVEALALSGWEMGDFLGRLLKDEGIAWKPVPIEGETRVALMVHDQSTGLEYRFLPEGPEVHGHEIDACADAIMRKTEGFAVASGSLPRGAPVDSYARLARAAARNGLPFVLDTSGAALKAALDHGGIFLVKPSQSELESYAGQALDAAGIEAAAKAIIARGQARMVAVTLGADGAVLATADRLLRLPAMKVKVRSAVGAGDSFLGAMVLALSQGWEIEQAFLLAIAAGAAATANPGTSLCRREDVFNLFETAGGRRPA